MPNQAHSLRRLLCVASLIVLAAGGCAQQPPQLAAQNLPAPTPRRVEFTNLTARTSAVDAAASVSADELLARVVALLREENSPARVTRLVGRFPDVALEVLRNTSAAQASQADRMAVAAAYDRAFIASGSAGWSKTLADAVLHPGEYESIHEARNLALQFIEMGRPQRVFDQIKVSARSGFPFADAEFLRVRGIAALLCDRPADALRDWRSAEELIRSDRSVFAEVCLLEAEAIRRGGRSADSIACWSTAAMLAATVHDPALWERLLDVRDESAPWPAEVTAAFRSLHDISATTAPAAGSPLPAAQVEACIWRQIGEWRFARGETSGALLAFKQAEAQFVQPRDKAEARIAEARALLAINQTGAAISILTSLTSNPDAQVNHHALAVLGNARIALDDIPGALTFLEAAVANDDSFPAALRAPARADLGLVCLMSAREKKGLICLHQAQADFEADHDNAGLVQCLRNEAAYLDSIGRSQEASVIRDRALRIAAIY